RECHPASKKPRRSTRAPALRSQTSKGTERVPLEVFLRLPQAAEPWTVQIGHQSFLLTQLQAEQPECPLCSDKVAKASERVAPAPRHAGRSHCMARAPAQERRPQIHHLCSKASDEKTAWSAEILQDVERPSPHIEWVGSVLGAELQGSKVS